jgi:hypothetical protein
MLTEEEKMIQSIAKQYDIHGLILGKTITGYPSF